MVLLLMFHHSGLRPVVFIHLLHFPIKSNLIVDQITNVLFETIKFVPWHAHTFHLETLLSFETLFGLSLPLEGRFLTQFPWDDVIVGVLGVHSAQLVVLLIHPDEVLGDHYTRNWTKA